MKKRIMMFLLFSLVICLSACSNASNDEAMWDEDNAAMWDGDDADLFDSEYLSFLEVSEDFDGGGGEMLRANAPRQRSESAANPTTISAERVIHRASTGIVVDDFDEGVRQVQELTAEFSGFVEQSYISGESSSSIGRMGDFTIRIPVESYDEMLEMLSELGDLNYLNTTAVNVSAQYADIVSRLTSLRTQEERVLELVESAVNLADLLLLEERLGELIYEIELLTGERNYLDNQISYSTIDIVITEYIEAFSGGDNLQPLGDVFMTSLRALGTFGGFVLRAVVALVPWLIPGGIVFLLIRVIWRRRRGKVEAGEKKQRLGKKKSIESSVE